MRPAASRAMSRRRIDEPSACLVSPRGEYCCAYGLCKGLASGGRVGNVPCLLEHFVGQGEEMSVESNLLRLVRKGRFSKDVLLEPSACCECGDMLERCFGLGQPEPGDFTLCIRCGCLNVFDETLRLRAPTDDELFEAAAHAGIQLARRAIERCNAKPKQADRPPETKGRPK